MKLAAISARFIFTPFIGSARLRRPAPLVLQNVVDITADGRMALLHVEPPNVPPLQRSIQQYSDVLARHSIPELQIYVIALLLQPEKVSEEVEVRKNPQIRFVEVDKDRDVQDDIWMEIA